MSGYFAREDELRHHDRIIRRFARRVTRSEADAEDAAQEAWLRSLQHPPLAERSIVRWLRVVVSRSALRTIGRERTRRLLLREVDYTDSCPSVPCQLEERGSRDRVERLIARLDEPYRTVLRLRFLDDLSPGEIAVVLQRPEVTVRSQLKRGLDRLRGRVDGERRLAGLGILFWRRLRVRATSRPVLAGLAAAGIVVVGALLVLARGGPRASDASSAPRLPVETAAVRPAPSERESIALASTPLDGKRVDEESVVAAQAAFAEGLVHRQGKGVAQAELWASVVLAAPVRRLAEPRYLGSADAEGRFRVALDGGSTVLWAEEVERGPYGVERARTGSQRYALLDLEVGARTRLDVEILGLARFHGVVLDASGAPAQGARVSCVQGPGNPRVGAEGVFELGPRPSWTTTDRTGRFELPVSASGVVDAWVEHGPGAAWSGEVSAAEDVTIRLSEPASLQGTVISPDGAPLADCEVRLKIPGGLCERTTRTDAQGRLRFDQVPPGEGTLAVLPSLAGLSALQHIACEPGELLELGNVTVSSSASLCGRAQRDGAPLAGWRVVARRPDGDGMLGLIETLTAADGSFEFKACRRKPHDLYLLDPAHDTGVPWAVLPGARPGVAAQLEARAPSAELYGVTVGLGGPSRLSLTAPHLPAAIHVPVPASGGFELRLTSGRYTPVLVLPGLGELALPDIELAEGEIQFLELALPETGALEVRLALPASQPRDAQLAVTLAGQGLASRFAAGSTTRVGALDLERGTLSVPRLLPGSYELTVSSPELGLLRRAVLVTAGETSWLDASLEPGTPVTVSFDAERPLHEGESLSLALSAPGLALEQSVAAVDVRSGSVEDVYELRCSLADGDYALEVESTGGLRGSMRFSLPGETRLALQLGQPPGATR